MTRPIYLARHGETDWNATGRWQGHTDVPLNARGRAQAAQLADALRHRGIRYVTSSDLGRARETASIVAGALGLPLGDAVPGLRERRFGVFEGLTRDECAARHPEAWARWVEDPRCTPPGAESYEDLAARIVLGAQGAAADTERAPPLLVTHGGSLRALLRHVHGRANEPIPNCAVYAVTWDGARFVDARLVASADDLEPG